LICPKADACSGCSNWGIPVERQRNSKQEAVLAEFQKQGLSLPAEILWTELPDRGLRDRLDFQIRGSSRGLWDKERGRIVDLPECFQLSPALQDWLSDFRQLDLCVEKGSFRLRVAPDGTRGIWLDFSNEDVKTLFEEKSTLQKLSRMAQVEVGQRRKALVFQDGAPKLLKETRFHTWTRTWLNGAAFPLFSRIADFSQVGDTANRTLIESLEKLLPSHSAKSVEFGSGNGNLSFLAFLRSDEMFCYEFDESVAQGFRRSLIEFETQFPEKKGKLQLFCGDWQKHKVNLAGADTVLVNPPRSGVGRFLEDLNTGSVRNLIYMSCYPESLGRDLAPFGEAWRCERLIFVDQFPQTDHVEILSLWKRR
jgi:23S rRNA (uracil1939-C5)-methyltransferase